MTSLDGQLSIIERESTRVSPELLFKIKEELNFELHLVDPSNTKYEVRRCNVQENQESRWKRKIASGIGAKSAIGRRKNVLLIKR